MRIVNAIERVITPVDAKLQPRNRIIVPWHTKNTLRLRAAKGENTISEEREDDRNSLMWVVSFLQPYNGIKGFTKS